MKRDEISSGHLHQRDESATATHRPDVRPTGDRTTSGMVPPRAALQYSRRPCPLGDDGVGLSLGAIEGESGMIWDSGFHVEFN